MAAVKVETNTRIIDNQVKRVLRWNLAQTHPVVVFLLVTFAWSWLIWLAAIPLKDQNPLLMMLISLAGGYGPAMAGILTLGLKNGEALNMTAQRWTAMIIIVVVLFGLMFLEYLAGRAFNYGMFAGQAEVSALTVVGGVLACLVGGWAISSARSGNPDILQAMRSIFPSGLKLGWTLAAFGFYAGMLLISWGICILMGADIEYPTLERPIAQAIPLFVLTFAITAWMRGGMEEPGWRGMLLPEMQHRFSPLVASLIIAVVWSVWHLPLYLNGFYQDDLVMGMVGGFILRIFLAIFMTWFYNRSGGNVLLIIILHTTFNLMPNLIPTSDLILVALWFVVVVAIVLKDKMYRKLPAAAAVPKTA